VDGRTSQCPGSPVEIKIAVRSATQQKHDSRTAEEREGGEAACVPADLYRVPKEVTGS
jgi:hypothetical protein